MTRQEEFEAAVDAYKTATLCLADTLVHPDLRVSNHVDSRAALLAFGLPTRVELIDLLQAAVTSDGLDLGNAAEAILSYRRPTK